LQAKDELVFWELKMNIRRYESRSLFDLMQYNLLPFSRCQTILTDRNNTVADWVLAVDIVEEIDKFVLQADVPGVDPVKIEAKRITIQAA
jgi:HSP20 family molecular chaperone IbpA